jgi:zinc protease
MQIPVFPKTHCFLLDNGLKTITHTDGSQPIVCLQLYIRTGSIWERPSQAGFSHIVEHLVFKRTRDFGFNEISYLISDLGGSINAYTDSDTTCYYLMLPSEHTVRGVHILSQMAFHARFNQEDLDIEKEIILEEIEQYANDPEVRFLEAVQIRYFRANPLRNPIMGSGDSVQRATLYRVRRFYRKHYNPSNAFIVASGDLQADILVSAIRESFGNWLAAAPASIPKLRDRFREPEKHVFRHINILDTSDMLALVVPELTDSHPDALALSCATRYLAAGKPSRLYKTLVEKTRLCSSVKIVSLSGMLSGVTIILLSPNSQKGLPDIRRILSYEFSKLFTYGVPQDELDLIQQDIIHSWAYDMDGNENIASVIGSEELLDGYEKLYSVPKLIDAIDADHVCAAIQKYLRPNYIAVFRSDAGSVPCGKACDFERGDFHPMFPSGHIASTSSKAVFHPKSANIMLSHDPSFGQIDARHWMGTLINGMHYIHKWNPHRKITGFALSLPVSQLCERPGERGLNFFTAASMILETLDRNREEHIRICRQLGLDLSVSQQTDCTILHGKCLSNDLPAVLNILEEVFSRPALSARSLNDIKASVADDIHREKDYPETSAFLKWQRLMLGKQNLLERPAGSLSDLRVINSARVRDWHRRFYQATGCVLSTCGPIPPDECWKQVNSRFSSLPAMGETPANLPIIPNAGPRYKLERSGSRQAIIHVGGITAPGSDQPATTAMHVLAQIIGGENSSRLFDLLREKQALAYHCGFELLTTRNFSYWYAFAMCDRDEYKVCLNAILDTLSDVAEHGVTEKELLMAQNYLVGSHRFDSESTSYQAMELSSLLALGYPPDHVINREQRIRAVSMDTIRSLANQWLRPDNHFTHILL